MHQAKGAKKDVAVKFDDLGGDSDDEEEKKAEPKYASKNKVDPAKLENKRNQKQANK